MVWGSGILSLIAPAPAYFAFMFGLTVFCENTMIILLIFEIVLTYEICFYDSRQFLILLVDTVTVSFHHAYCLTILVPDWIANALLNTARAVPQTDMQAPTHSTEYRDSSADIFAVFSCQIPQK